MAWAFTSNIGGFRLLQFVVVIVVLDAFILYVLFVLISVFPQLFVLPCERQFACHYLKGNFCVFN